MRDTIRGILEFAGVPIPVLDREVTRLLSAIDHPSGSSKHPKSRSGKKARENKVRRYAAISKALNQAVDLTEALRVIFVSEVVVQREFTRINRIIKPKSSPTKRTHRAGIQQFCDSLLQQYSTPTDPSIFEIPNPTTLSNQASPQFISTPEPTSSQNYVHEFSVKIRNLKANLPEPQLIKAPEQRQWNVKETVAKLCDQDPPVNPPSYPMLNYRAQ